MAHYKWTLEPQLGHFYYQVDIYVTNQPINKRSGTFYARHVTFIGLKVSLKEIKIWPFWPYLGHYSAQNGHFCHIGRFK